MYEGVQLNNLIRIFLLLDGPEPLLLLHLVGQLGVEPLLVDVLRLSLLPLDYSV